MHRSYRTLALILFLALPACSGSGGKSKTDGMDAGGSSDKGAVADNRTIADNGTTADKGQAADKGSSTSTKVKLTTSLGDIELELNAAKAPITVANFLKYVDAGFYDGTIFHRVISNFMIQGGGYTTSMTKKTTNPAIKNEATNGLSNLRGTIAMARTSVVDSATSQFFINVVDNKGLDYKSSSSYGYAVFGKVVSGMATVDKIKAVPTGAKAPFSKDAPLTDVVIKSAKRM